MSGSDQDIASNKGRKFLESYHEEEPPGGPRRQKRQPDLNHHEVKVLEFEGKLDPNKFLKWLCNIKRIFDYHKVLEQISSSSLFLD